MEYDESGTTTYYFLLAIFGLVLLPLTYYLFPRRKESDKKDKFACKCEGCIAKSEMLAASKPKSTLKNTIKIVGLVLGWILFAYLFYRVFTMERTITIYDPYEILEIDRGATTQEIKKQYRELSKVYHPDKDTGDPVKFMKIAKAYEALTDEEARKNWEEYGNPDGPQAATFGIALPSWIVSKENSGLVLAIYVGVFMVALPIVIGTWWYRSVKYSSANILLSTQQLYFYLISRMSTTPVKRLISILTCALEFTKEHSTGIKERVSDNEELPKLMNELPHVMPKNKDRFFSSVPATKARVLVHAHLSRCELTNELIEDLHHILKLSPRLINEILTILQQAYFLARYRHMKDLSCPSLESFENAMKLSPMMVQSLWDSQSMFLQIPHLNQENLRHFHTKRRRIQSMEDLAKMKDSDRRQLVRTLTDEQYNDMLIFLAQFPYIEMTASASVEDDEDVTYITAGAVVTVTVELKREGLLEHYGQSPQQSCNGDAVKGNGEVVEEEGEEKAELVDGGENRTPSPGATAGNSQEDAAEKKSSHKEISKRRKKGGKSSKKGSKPQKKKKQENKNVREDSPKEDIEAEKESEGLRQRHKQAVSAEGKEDDVDGDEEDKANDSDNDDWSKVDKDEKKEKKSEVPLEDSHPVHCPNFPLEKQECWWIYVVNKKTRQFVSFPQRVTGLKDTKTVSLQCQAPPKPSFEQYSVVLRSDSYIDLKEEYLLKITVHPAKEEVVETKQWRELEEEEEEEEAFEETDDESQISDSEHSD